MIRHLPGLLTLSVLRIVNNNRVRLTIVPA
jgi:hypothetical protein